MSQPRMEGKSGKIIVHREDDTMDLVNDYIEGYDGPVRGESSDEWETRMDVIEETLKERMESERYFDMLQEAIEGGGIEGGMPWDIEDVIDMSRARPGSEEYYPGVFDAELQIPELKRKKAGGGKIKKVTRRDVLKGIGALGAGAVGAGIAGTKKGTLDPAAAGAKAAADEAVAAGAQRAWSKQDFSPRQWNTINHYITDRLDDLYDQLQYFQDRLRSNEIQQQTQAGQRTLRDMADVEAEIEQLEWIEGADLEYVFEPSSQEYLEEFIEDTINDLNLDVHDYGDFDDVNDPRVTHIRELERIISPRRSAQQAEELERMNEALRESAKEPRPMGGLGPRKKPEMAGGGSIKKALKRLQEARMELEESSDPDIDLVGREMMADEDETIRNVGRRLVANEARVEEMSIEEAEKYYQRISRLLDEAEARLAQDPSE